MSRIAILGAGSWGTGLAAVLSQARRQHELHLWARDAALARSITLSRENKSYLPGISLPANIDISTDLSAVLRASATILCAIPSAHVRTVFTEALPHISNDTAIVSATKGLEPATHMRITEVIAQTLALRFVPRLAVLSGPSFAIEAARGEPTAVALASHDRALAAFLQEEFAGPTFRLYTNEDVLGVELAGAMKNVMAIAAGACQGLGLGHNSLAALITRGLAEMTRLGVKLGARQETFSGLAGLGDLVLTCTGTLSRNRHVGFELGRGRTLNEILGAMNNMVAEGVATTAALLALAREQRIDLPVTEQVHSILYHGNSPREAIRAIMERPLRGE